MKTSFRIFLINLDRRTDRLAYISDQMRKLNLEFTKISAIDGQFLSIEEQNLIDVNQFIVETKKKPVLGELGCALSHRAVWQKIVNEKIEYALIIEDDVKIDDAILELLSKKDFLQQFDFLNFSSNQPYQINNDILKELVIDRKVDRKTARDYRSKWKKLEWSRNWKIFKIHSCADHFVLECDPAPALGSGYWLSNHAAQCFLEASEKLNFPIDWVWRYSGGELRQAFVATPLITQNLQDTDIKGRDNIIKLTLHQMFKRRFHRVSRKLRLNDLKKLYPDC